jgi:hypothetical protein
MIHDKSYSHFYISKKLKNKDKESKHKSATKRNLNQSKKVKISRNKNIIKKIEFINLFYCLRSRNLARSQKPNLP